MQQEKPGYVMVSARNATDLTTFIAPYLGPGGYKPWGSPMINPLTGSVLQAVVLR